MNGTINNSDPIYINGGDSTDVNTPNLTVDNLTVNNDFYINSIQIGNTELATLQGINGNIQEQINNIADITNGTGYYGSFWNTQTITNPTANTILYATLNSYDTNNNNVILYDSIGSGYYRGVQVVKGAVYNIQFSIQTSSTSSSKDDIKVWLRKNGNDIESSGGVQSISQNDGHFIMSYNIILKLQDNDYINLMWSATSTSLYLDGMPATTTPYNSPISPSVIITLQQVQYYQDNIAIVNELEADLTTANNNITTLQNKTQAISYNSTTQTTQINGSLNIYNPSHPVSIYNNGNSLDNIYANKNTTESDITNLNNAVISLQGQVNDNKDDITANTAAIGALTLVVGGNSTDIATINGELVGIGTSITTLTTGLSTANDEILALEGKTQFITTNEGTLTTYIANNVSLGSIASTIYINGVPYIPYNPATSFLNQFE